MEINRNLSMEKRKVIFTRGMQASGKTTWAEKFLTENQDYKRVSRDIIRLMFSNYTFDNPNEKMVTKAEVMLTQSIIESGCNLIVDKMNLNKDQMKKDINLIKMMGIDSGKDFDVEVKEFPITLAEAIERDSKRPLCIGKTVLKNTWRRYEIELKQMLENAKTIIPYNVELPDCIIVDVDGTLSNSINRKVFDYKNCGDDFIIKPSRSIVVNQHHAWKYERRNKVFAMTGREDSCREETRNWLNAWNTPIDSILMRTEGDHRKDTIIKKELYEHYIKDRYNVLYVMEDRPSVMQMWIDLGLFVVNMNQDPMCKNNF